MASDPGQLQAINPQTFSKAIWNLPETKKKTGQAKGRSHMLSLVSIDDVERSRSTSAPSPFLKSNGAGITDAMGMSRG